jgi:hypothetical protein
MPPSLNEWVGEGDLAWFIVESMGGMEPGGFCARYREDGSAAAAYAPKMMVRVLLYAYRQGVRSPRKIAGALARDVGFRMVCANQSAAGGDFRTVCRFRAERESELERLYVVVLSAAGGCRETGKEVLGFWRFARRGLEAATSEAFIVSTAHNP